MTRSPFNHSIQHQSLLIPTFKSFTIVESEDIVYIQAMQNYCMLYKKDKTRILSSLSFGKMLELLSFHNLYQCHKSYAIKVNKLVGYSRKGEAELEGDLKVPVARRRKKEFLKLINQNFYRSSRKMTVCQ